MEYSIGDFSRICRLGIKTLRYYHEIGLLAPTRIDRLNGYRYYDESLLDRVLLIQRLKSLDFSLDEIKELLKNTPTESAVVRMAQRKLAEIEQKISEYRQMSERLKGFLIIEQTPAVIPTSSETISEILIPALYIASLRFQGRYEDIGEWLEKLYRSCGSRITGCPFSLYYDNQSMEQDADIEICLPVDPDCKIEGLNCRWLPGGRALSLIHRGVYENLSLSYQIIVNEIYRRGLQIILPNRELYLKGPSLMRPDDPTQYRTEIQLMLPTDK
jgi:DNA-binding transcriptional MerR regulator